MTRDQLINALRWAGQWGVRIAILIVAIIGLASFVIALLLLVQPEHGQIYNETFLAPIEYSNRVTVAGVLISLAGFAAAFLGILRAVVVIQRGQRGPVLLELAELRTEGVELRNTGKQRMDQPTREAWYREFEDWKLALYSKLKELSEFESEKLRTLDTFDPHPFSPVESGEAQQKLSELHTTLERLYELLQQYQ